MLRSTIIFLLVFLISVPGFSEDLKIPSDENISNVYKKHPLVIHEMVRKLYVIEHSALEINLPEHSLVFTDKSVIVNHNKPGKVFIGNEKYNLDYSFKVDSYVIQGVRKDDSFKISPAWYITGSVILFVLGFGSGIYVMAN